MKARIAKTVLIYTVCFWLVGCQSASSSVTASPSIERGTSILSQSDGGPLITVLPPAAEPGSRITVRGERFPPGTFIGIYLAPDSSSLPKSEYFTVSAASDGSFEASFYLPDMWPDDESIVEQQVIIAAVTDDLKVAAVTFLTVQPGESSLPILTLDPDRGAPGILVGVTGSDFEPDTAIDLYLGVPQTGLNDVSLATAVSDGEGRFLTTVTIPAEWPGTSDVIVERDLVIGAVDEIGRILATAPFVNVVGQ